MINKLLKNETEVILGFDNDAWDKSKKTYNYLTNLGLDVRIIRHEKYNDLSQAYENEGKPGIIRLLQNAQKYDSLDDLKLEFE